MNRVFFSLGFLALLVGLVTATGCGGTSYDGPARAAVTGSVTFDGKPLPFGVITFVPQGEGRRASGVVLNGKYTIEEERGPNLGSYKVQILGYAEAPPEDNAPEEGADDAAGEGEGDADLGPQILPETYNTSTTLTAEIVSGPNTHDFTMTAGGE